MSEGGGSGGGLGNLIGGGVSGTVATGMMGVGSGLFVSLPYIGQILGGGMMLLGGAIAIGSLVQMAKGVLDTVLFPLRWGMDLLNKWIIKPLTKIGKAGFKLMKQAFGFLFDAAKQLDKTLGATQAFQSLEILFLPIQLAFDILGKMLEAGAIDAVKVGFETLKKYIDFIVFSGEAIGTLAGIPFTMIYTGLGWVADSISALGGIAFASIKNGIGWIVDKFEALQDLSWKNLLPDWMSGGEGESGGVGRESDFNRVPKGSETNITMNMYDAFVGNTETFINTIIEEIEMRLGL